MPLADAAQVESREGRISGDTAERALGRRQSHQSPSPRCRTLLGIHRRL